MTPTTKSTHINAQQQPRHQAPCRKPIRKAPAVPSRQFVIRNPSGLRQWVRHLLFQGVSCHAPAAIRIAPDRRPLEEAIAADNIAASCNPHCARAAPKLKLAHTARYPSPNAMVVSGTLRLPRPAPAAANSSSMGAADGAIMPAIITAHI